MGRSIGPRLRFEVLSRDGFTCQYCGAPSPRVQLEIDHRVPVCRGGLTRFDNLVTACHDCNAGKATLDADPSGNRSRLRRAIECIGSPWMGWVYYALWELKGHIRDLPDDELIVAMLERAVVVGVADDDLISGARRFSDFESWEAWLEAEKLRASVSATWDGRP